MARAGTLRARAAGRRRRLTLARREAWLGLALVAPAALVVAGVYLYPAVATLIYSVSELDAATLAIERFVGLDNFVGALESPVFREAALRTVSSARRWSR
jgi:multiple sugar transport system permease protein